MSKICIVTSAGLSAKAQAALTTASQTLTALGCEVLQKVDDDLATPRERNRVHDLKEALMTMEHVMRDLERGYQFDDEFAEEKQKVIAKAVATLDKECKAWLALIRP